MDAYEQNIRAWANRAIAENDFVPAHFALWELELLAYRATMEV